MASSDVKLKAASPKIDGTIEAVGKMHALVYFCRGNVKVIPDRPIICTSQDVVARVDLVHRCGTDVKIFFNGRPDQLDEGIVIDLKSLLKIDGDFDSRNLELYVDLLMPNSVDEGNGRQETRDRDSSTVRRPAPNGSTDSLYASLKSCVEKMSDQERRQLWSLLEHYWGRIVGHEMVVTIMKVGSQVKELTNGIGYMAGERLSEDYLDFKVGDRYVVQTRIARYDPPAVTMDRSSGRWHGKVRGIQLLGRNITDLAMSLNGAYAQCIRLTPEIIQSGSLIPVPKSLDDAQAAMVEPAACLLDCFEKCTHELGQDDRGSIVKKGVMRNGVTAIIGSGSMAILAGRFATMEDEKIIVGGAREVVYFVRSQDKVDLIRSLATSALKDRLHFVISRKGASDNEILSDLKEQYAMSCRQRVGKNFEGFDDVILCAGDAQTLSLAHKLITHTGARVLAFAGTRGEISLESGTWHYGNAGTIGTSGCNTKMMGIVLGLLGRGSLSLAGLSGKEYTLNDLLSLPSGEGSYASGLGGKEYALNGLGADPQAFFSDNYLRPRLKPNAGLEEVQWNEE